MFLIVYPMRKLINKYPKFFKVFILYWFTNNDEPTYEDNWYGVNTILNNYYEKFRNMNIWQKFWLSFEWVVIRNPHWEAKLLMSRFDKGEMDINSIIQKGDLIGDDSNTIWRNKFIFGRQSITYKLKGRKTRFFRHSYTRDLKKWSPFRLLGYKYVNLMVGYENEGKGRVILKYRVFVIEDEKIPQLIKSFTDRFKSKHFVRLEVEKIKKN